MNAVELLQRLHQHRAWVNANLLAAAATLSNEQLRSEFQIGQGSIWKLLLKVISFFLKRAFDRHLREMRTSGAAGRSTVMK